MPAPGLSVVTLPDMSPFDRGGWDYLGTYFTAGTAAITAFPVFGRIQDVPDEIEYDAFDVTHLSYQQISALNVGDLHITMTFTTSTSDPFDTHDIHVWGESFPRGEDNGDWTETSILLSKGKYPYQPKSDGSLTGVAPPSPEWDYLGPNFTNYADSNEPPDYGPSIFNYPSIPLKGSFGPAAPGKNDGVQQSDDVTSAVLQAYKNNNTLFFSFFEASGGVSQVSQVTLHGVGVAQGLPVLVGAEPVQNGSDKVPVNILPGVSFFDDSEGITVETVNFKLTDDSGHATDAHGTLTGGGLLKIGVGSYQLTGIPAQSLASILEQIKFVPTLELAGPPAVTNLDVSIAGPSQTSHYQMILQTSGTTHQFTFGGTIGPASGTDQAPYLVFPSLTVSDVDPGAKLSAKLVVTPADNAQPGSSADPGLLSGPGLVQQSDGSYVLTATTPQQLQSELQSLSYKLNSGQVPAGQTHHADVKLTVMVDGSNGISNTLDVALSTLAFDPGPTAAPGLLMIGHNQSRDVTSLIRSLVTPGLNGDTETITSLLAASGSTSIGANGALTYISGAGGTDTLTYVVTDQIGNVATNRIAVTIDPGPTVMLTSAAVDGNRATQRIAGRVISGQSATIAGQTVTLTDNGVTLGTAIVAADGSFKADVILQNQGANSIVATVTDIYGNVAASAPVVDKLDSVAPTITLTGAAVAGNQATQTIIGTVVSGGTASVVGQTVTLTDNGNPLGTATVAPDGSFTTNVVLPNQGANAISYGNTGASAAVVDTLDNIAPTISGLKSTAANGSTASHVAARTISGVVTLDGAASVIGQTVTVTDNGQVLGTATVAADGSFTTNVALPNLGANKLVASVADSYGNVGTSAAIVDTIDTIAPTVTLTSSAIAGNKATQTITGTVVSGGKALVAGRTVTLTDNGQVLGTAKVAANGTFAANVILPNQGANAIVASVADSNGNVGTSATIVDTLDTITPTVTLTSQATAGNQAAQTIAGTVASGGTALVAGQTVTLTDNGNTLGSTTVAADGSFTANVILQKQGANAIVATVTDTYGNKGASAPIVDTLDTIAPTIKITSAAVASNQATQTITGTVVSGGAASVAGRYVTFTDNGIDLPTSAPFRTDADGKFSATIALPNQGANAIVARVTDSYGNKGTSGAIVDTIDTIAPTVTLTSSAIAGNKATQTITGTVVSGGTALVAGRTVTLTDNGQALGTAKVAANGTFAANVILPNQGANAIVASLTDSYGNVGTSATIVDTLDTIAPTVTLTSQATAGKQAAQTIAGTVASGGTALVAGQTVTLTDNGNALGSTTVAADGSFTTNVVLPNRGTNAIVATVTDTYGNKGASAALVDILDPGPTAGTARASVKLGTATNVTASILTAAKPGLAGDTLTITADDTTATTGSLSLVNGQLVYTASGAGLSHIAANKSQTDSFGYTISDQYGDTATGTATITVTNPALVINGPPCGAATIQGTAGTDLINASGSANTIYANGGNDIINAGQSAQVYTGDGDVVTHLAGGANRVTGGDGNNTVSGSTSRTTILLGNGANSISAGGVLNTIAVGTGANNINAGSGQDTVTAGAGFDTIRLGGNGNSVTLNGSTASVGGGQGNDTITVNGGYDGLTFAGSNSQAILNGVTVASIMDLGKALRVTIGSATQTDTIGGFGTNDPLGVVDFQNGAGGFASAQAVVDALHSDGHGGTMLALGATGSIDFSGTAPNQLHASNFAIG